MRVVVRDLFTMLDLVVVKHVLATQVLVATFARKLRPLFVGLEMLFLVCHLVERLMTALDWA